jgi:PKD repeat protein
MIKKIAFAGVGLVLFASPLVASAQGVSASNASLIAALTALVQILEQELQQLIALQQGSPQNGPALLTATPINGAAPLTVEFHINPSAASANQITFGDDKTNVETLGNGPGNSCGDPNESECAHTYTTAGTYTAQIYDVKSEVLGTATITVTEGSQYPLSATPTSGQAPLAVTFTASGMTDQYFYHVDFGDGQTSNGLGGVSTTATHTYSSAGTYTAQLEEAPNACFGVTAECLQVQPTNWTSIGVTTITVTAPSTSLNESATLDVSAMSFQTANFAITGSAVAHSIVVELINSSYSGSTDSNTTSQYLKGGSTYAVENNSGTGDILSNNGRWTVSFYGVAIGSYKVLVYSGDAYSIWPLTTGTLTVSSPALYTNPNGLPQCPANSAQQRGSMGQTFKCACPAGFTTGAVWGGPSYYSDNSDICTAGAQIGQMNSTTGGEVDYEIAPAQNSYPSWTANGITSQAYGTYWPGSFQIVGPKG